MTFFNRQSKDIADGLVGGDIDLGLIRDTALTKKLESRLLDSFGYWLYVPKKLRLRLAETVEVRALHGLRLALLEGSGEFRTSIEGLAAEADVELNVQLECSSSTQVAYAVGSLGYAGILPSFAAPVLGRGKVSVHKIRGYGLSRKLVVAWNPRRAELLPVIKDAAMTLVKLVKAKA